MAELILEDKRVIDSVQGVKALSTGFIDCVPAELIINAGRSTEPPRGYAPSLNAVTGHSLKTRGVIDLPLRLGLLEKTISFVVVDQLHVDVMFGIDALREFKAMINLEDNLAKLKGTGEASPIGSPRVEESYHARISSSVRICPGGQALVAANIAGTVEDGVTILVEGLVVLKAAVRVARTLFSVQKGKEIVEICNTSTENIIVKRGTPLAATFSLGASLDPARGQGQRDSEWVDSVIRA
ncbi:hypothetical protein F444_22413 [Phytophthora nicotianae P1976]|uniref:Aspartic peptidase DDI1-type domain-containing protein n=1 Tax=Phytophthora nicotianae P1976 TaxID=1317066 RepID=A0A080YXV4_PHYNI|nr:hypothetical protein F444_22413 [Phytophthora nicotianae P1976]